jgi:hypothetical protein
LDIFWAGRGLVSNGLRSLIPSGGYKILGEPKIKIKIHPSPHKI